ncbi:MAG: bifunctional oligoribonuclease/PAP phosphatase NrnA [Candidatus Hermodarchaeota archaeon]
MLKAKFEELKTFLKNKNILISTHGSVDIDAYASCFLFKILIEAYFENQALIYFPKLSKHTQGFIEKLLEKFPNTNLDIDKNTIDISKIDLIFILDTNNLDQVEMPNNLEISQLHIPIIFIDHHLELNKNYEENIKSLNIISDNVSSTTEIIYEFAKYLQISLDLPSKYILMAGILTDTGFFKYANNETIKRVSSILNEQINIQEIFSLLETKQTISERIARIKALQRVTLERINNWLIGITHVGGYEANVATLLINVGCDVSIVYSKKKKEYRISTRAKKEICEKTNLHLGRILEEVSAKNGHSGGGHNSAASLNSKIDLTNVLDKIIDKIKQILK